MRKHTRRILASSSPRGDLEAVRRLVARAPELDADAIALVGDLVGEARGRGAYRELFRTLGDATVPVFFVPGPTDAPLSDYLREAYNLEIAFPHLHSVHESFAFAPGFLAVAGVGGEVVDAEETEREEAERLRYPGWAAEYALKVLGHLRDYPKLFLFATPPAHKGLHQPGSEVLAELIKTYSPRAAIAAGEGIHEARLGNSLVVVPGSLARSECALVDVIDQTVKAQTLL